MQPSSMTPVPTTRLLIAGASVRAAWQSAQRGGFQAVVLADLFGDVEVLESGAFHRLSSGYAELAEVAAAAGVEAWMYTGALENHPDRVAAASSHGLLWGNNAECLRAVRDPWRVARALAEAGCAAPELARDAASLPRDGSWLRKPLASAAGLGVRAWTGEADDGRPGYFQRRLPGVSCGAVFVGAKGRAWLWGVTEQKIGPAHGAPRPFQYAGSHGPRHLDDAERAAWQAIGSCLARHFDLQGLFGVDALVARPGDTPGDAPGQNAIDSVRVVPVEVNPRYTASVEVLERTSNWNAVTLQCHSCVSGLLPGDPGLPAAEAAGPMACDCSKTIVYASEPRTIDDDFHAWVRCQNERTGVWPRVADIPPRGETIAAGHPVVTLLEDDQGSVSRF
jgi:predicted ATP-grasp superfamily ATP-dependent carboligase